MAYENYTISQFMKAWFNKDYSEMSQDEFTIVYGEYMDASGMFLSEDFERVSYISHLRTRLEFVKMYVDLQRRFIKEFDAPYVKDFEMLKDRYGYVLKWKNDLIDFEKQLKTIERREKKFETELDNKIDELVKLRKSKERATIEDDDDLKKSRVSFIKMLNSLGKVGYKVDKFSTTVEELALMIKAQFDEIETLKNS